jgi:N-acetylmuramoyl-L-alanine amidase
LSKLSLVLGLVLAGLLAGPSAFGAVGSGYLPLADWARLNGWKITRNPGSREITANGPGGRLAMVIDGSRMQFNDVSIWLSNPVQLFDNQVCVASQDVRAVLNPLTRPPLLPAGKRVRTICLDPGHGGKDPGHRTGSRLEKAYTLALAREVRSKLVAAGFNVVLTRREDEYVDHPERTSMASRLKADLFVSLHFNASPDGSSDANGFEVYAMTPEGARSTNISRDIGSLKAWSGNEADGENLLLAYQVQRALLQRLPGSEDRGVRRARFLVLRLSEMPAILIEGGFMTNPSDARYIYSDTGRSRLAQGITDGILAYRRQVERTAPSPPPTAAPAPAQRGTSSRSSTNNARPESARN